MDTEGSVRFETDGAGGTIVRVDMRYDPPGGVAGDRIARLLGNDLEAQVEEDLRRFKVSMESSLSELSPPAAAASADDQATAAGLS